MSPRLPADDRSPDRIRAHYEVERELSDLLRTSPADERLSLYSRAYDALFERVPDHPQLTRAADEAGRRQDVAGQLAFLRRFLRPGGTFLELGAGDCALARAVAPTAHRVYALDVSESILADAREAGDIQVVVSDGVSVDVPPGTVDVAYSNQVMEHLHPDDAIAQLRNVEIALAHGGQYVVVTPNRLNGPHDVSMYFDHVATGFHLKEYTVTELSRLMRGAGFSRVASYAHVKGKTVRVPLLVAQALETLLDRLPRRLGSSLACRRPWRWILGIHVVARKS